MLLQYHATLGRCINKPAMSEAAARHVATTLNCKYQLGVKVPWLQHKEITLKKDNEYVDIEKFSEKISKNFYTNTTS